MSSGVKPPVVTTSKYIDALLEFETFKKKFLLANKHITKLNSTLSVRIEELNAQISSLYVENLRLRASENALLSQLKQEREKSRKLMADVEAACFNLTGHLRQTFGIGPMSPPPPPPPTALASSRAHPPPSLNPSQNRNIPQGNHLIYMPPNVTDTSRPRPLNPRVRGGVPRYQGNRSVSNPPNIPGASRPRSLSPPSPHRPPGNRVSRAPNIPGISEESESSSSPSGDCEHDPLSSEEESGHHQLTEEKPEEAICAAALIALPCTVVAGCIDIPVLDLSNEIRIIDPHATACGGFADIHRGEWIQGTTNPEERANAQMIRVAVKLLRVFTRRDADSGRTRKRLNREVYVWKRLNHPNIAKFYGVSFQLGGRPALVMQWYENGTAPCYLSSQTDERRLQIVRDVCRGLKYLHALPVVHGDLKGNNVLIDDDGHAVLTDFGLSRVIEELTGPTGNTTTAQGGTIRWQAPELMFDEPEEECDGAGTPSALSLASDVWSFACTAYELLTGRIPYEDYLHDWKVMQDVMQGVSPVRPEDKVIHSSHNLSALLSKCWAPGPSFRPNIDAVEKGLDVVIWGP